MSDLPEEPIEIEELFPGEGELDAQALLDASTEELEEIESLEGDEEVEVVEADLPPIGRGWAFDFDEGHFVMEGRSPSTVRGEASITVWIEKCLRTHQGSSVAQPPEFGLGQSVTDFLGGNPDDVTALESDIEEALTFHPAISAVENIVIDDGLTPQGDAAVAISFDVILADGTAIPFEAELDPEAAF
jgi:hypothetical protein